MSDPDHRRLDDLRQRLAWSENPQTIHEIGRAAARLAERASSRASSATARCSLHDARPKRDSAARARARSEQRPRRSTRLSVDLARRSR